MIIFSNDNIFNDNIYSKKRQEIQKNNIQKNLVPNLKPPRRPKRPVWGTKWLGQEVISAVVHDMKKGYS